MKSSVISLHNHEYRTLLSKTKQCLFSETDKDVSFYLDNILANSID